MLDEINQIKYKSCFPLSVIYQGNLNIWKSGRVAECVCLENRSRAAPDRGFESYLFRFVSLKAI